MNRIKELPKASSQLLSSTQIISSVQSVVKELVENSLDSCSTNIEVRLDDFGLEKIEVKDNGKGIHKDDIAFVAKPHCTSKITSHSDLSKIETYGFRGEALAALCAVSVLSVTTKTADDVLGYTYTFDFKGNIGTTKPCPYNQGTSIVASNLFKNIPVRRQFYRPEKNKKDELKKIEDILIAFGCIQTRVRFTLFHNRNLIWQKPSVQKTIQSLIHIFGNQVVDHLENCTFTDDDSQINIEVFLPKQKAPLVCSQSSSNKSIIVINKRPVRMKVIDKILKEYYNKSLDNTGKSRYPICYISVQVPPTTIDVNYEPNKTAVALDDSNIVVDQLTKILTTFYSADGNPEINIPQPIQTSSLELVPSSAALPKSSTPKKSADICNESTDSSFHLKLSHLAPDFKKTPSSKLSRKRESDPSSNKKRRTSDFATPPNDIHRHISTLKSFFTAADADKSNPPLELGTSLDEIKTAKHSVENLSTKGKEAPALNNQFNAVTVQRANVLETPLKSNHFSNALQKVATNEASELMNTLHSENELQTDKVNELLAIDEQLSNTSSSNTIFKALHNNDSIEAIIDIDSNEQLSSINGSHIKLNNFLKHTRDAELEICLSSRKSIRIDAITEKSTTIDINEWSRGLHPSEKTVQPVTLLKQKQPQSPIETDKDFEILENQAECGGISPNQRKITAFDFFCRKHRLEVAALHPDYNNHQIAQILTEKWSLLSLEEKNIYKNITIEDFTKNIKSKENVGKSVNESLNNTKEKSQVIKRVRKMKKKNKECHYVFNMDLLKNSINQMSCSRDELHEDLHILSCLSPGVWACYQKCTIFLLNSFRLQETVVFHRLLETYQFESEPLNSPLILTTNSLGDDGIKLMSEMNTETDYKNECFILNDVLSANGFKIKVLQNEGRKQFEVVEMTSNIAFYGVSDLKEICSIFLKEGLSVPLNNCRPAKVILYLQGEAVRIARQYPTSKKVEDIEDLLNHENLLSSVCIHSKPILHELYTIGVE